MYYAEMEFDIELMKNEYEDSREELEEAAKEGGNERLQETWEEKKNEWKKQKVNVAIIGRSGDGKSSFINAVIEKWTGKRGTVKTGINETTMECKGYPHPDNPNIMLWDLPGVGTGRFPQKTYLDKVSADLYDLFIIMTATRFSEEDAWLAAELEKTKKSFVFVRTKIGIDISNTKHYYPTMDEEVILKKVKKSTCDEIKKYCKLTSAKSAEEVFLIDNHHPDDYQFDDLVNCIVEKLSKLQAEKGEAVVFSITNKCISRETLERKVSSLYRQINYTSCWAGICATIPGVSALTDEPLVKDRVAFFIDQLGLNAASLAKAERSIHPEKQKELEDKVGRVIADIPNIVRRHGLVDTSDGSIIRRVVGFFGRVVPVLSSKSSANTVYNSLCEILNKFKAIAIEAIECEQRISTNATE